MNVRSSHKFTAKRQIIPVRPEKEGAPLSFSQQRFWFLSQLEPDNPVYNYPVSLRLTGELNIAILEQVLDEIVKRHRVLHTSFPSVDGKPVQRIIEAQQVNLQVIDLAQFGRTEREAQMIEIATESAQQPFDLARGPMLRTTLVQLDKGSHVLILVFHRIVFDAWSTKVLINEITTIYKAYANRQPSPLLALPIQYADFADWQRSTLKNGAWQDQLLYWKEKLAGAATHLDLTPDRPPPAKQTFLAASQYHRLPTSLLSSLNQLSRKEDVTLFMILLAAFQTLIYRYTGQTDIVVGTPIATRSNVETEGLIGCFSNTLVLRIDLSGNPTFLALLARVREMTVAAYANQDIPFERLLEELQPERNLSISPLFQVMFSLEHCAEQPMVVDAPSVAEFDFETETTLFDLTFAIITKDDALHCKVKYNSDLFDSFTIERMLEHYRMLLLDMVKDPTRLNRKTVHDFELLSAEEKRKLLIEWNETAAEYRKDKCIHELFEQQVRKRPNEVAVVFEKQHLTYKQLDEKSAKLAVHLQRRGVKPDSLVGICLERSLEMIVGILGILKAGGAYVPLDPDYPEARIRYMLEDSGAKILLTQNKLEEKVSGLLCNKDSEVIAIDNQWASIEAEQGKLERKVRSTDLAYVIYTSGSTGRPKGVMVEHRSVINTLDYLESIYPVQSGDTYLLKTNTVFDVSLTELMGWFFGQGRLVILPPGAEKSPQLILEYVDKEKVTHINFVPSMLQAFVSYIAGDEARKLLSIRYLMIAGEAFPKELVSQVGHLLNRKQKVENIYGPTETSIYASGFSCQDDSVQSNNTPIGKPITNTQLYILDKHLKVVPIGVAGELFIAGDGLARGYLTQPQLTQEKFIENPFNPGTRMYKTGDLARWLPDGNIEFLGRIDHQVKIRGFRIECGEIEAVLVEHAQVQGAVVVARSVNNSTQLIAYYVGDQSKALEGGELRSYLQSKLPDYMIPASFVLLAKLPLTPTGKIDRQVLMKREVELVSSQEYVAPRTETEEQLAGIWAEVLGVKRVGMHDNFFELGGHSLSAMQIISRINQRFGVEVALRRLFEAPGIKGLSIVIGESSPYQTVPIASIKRPEQLPLSYAQERLWFLAQLGYSEQYHIPEAVQIKGRLDEDALQKTLTFIVRRHESLRTGFRTLNGAAIQVMQEAAELPLDKRDLSGLSKQERERESQATIRDMSRRPFALERAPLMRVVLIKLEAETYIFVMCMHHIISDGWSMGILIREMSQAYAAYARGRMPELTALKIQYADYAVWQRQVLTEEKLEKELSYWKKQLAGYEDLDLSADYARPKQLSGKGGHVRFQIDKEAAQALRKLCQEKQVTLFTVLVAGVYILLRRYSGQEDICIGMPVANRNHCDIEDLIGFFVNTLVLRIDTREERALTFEQLLRKIHCKVVEAQDKQNVPFEKVVESIQPRRDLSRTPIFQVLVNHFNMGGEELQFGDSQLAGVDFDYGISKFDLTFDFSDSHDGGGITLTLEYSHDLYREETITRMGGHLVRIMKQLVEDAGQAVDEVELLTGEEKQKIFIEWNNTAAEYPRDKCIHELFEEQVRKTPNQVAVVFEDQKLSYQELDERSTKLGVYLQKQGIKPDSLVAICTERSLEMIVGILAILKAGGAYVPIDPEYPEARLQYMLEDSTVKIVLTQEKLKEKVSGLLSDADGKIIAMDKQWPEIARGEGRLQREVQSNHLAYVIYTSGSTGKPKGVMIPHTGLVNYISWAVNYYLDKGIINHTTPVYGTITFDATITSIFVPLLSGNRLSLYEKGSDIENMTGILREHNDLYLFKLTPSHIRLIENLQLDSDFKTNINTLVIGGDALFYSHISIFREKHSATRLINEYGPTETVVGCCIYDFCVRDEPLEGNVPIGKPIHNTQLYILGQNLTAVPIGVPGELYIAGASLARGYLNQPELTQEKFIENPFNPGTRMYKTGDLARWLADGNIDFLGRIDHQVKVRGFRIECGEIESVLAEHPDVREAVVIARSANHSTQLISYYAAVNHARMLEASELRSYLKSRLPDYMIPVAFVGLEALPLTPNGKVDRKALQKREVELASSQEYVAPQTEAEQELAGIWQEVLGVERVGLYDNFFELGGHSLLAIKMVAKIRERLGIECPVKNIFDHATVYDLSRLLPALAGIPLDNRTGFIPKKNIKRNISIPLSNDQSQFWAAWLVYKDSLDSYHIYDVSGPIDRLRLEQAFNILLQRHESVWACFSSWRPVQRIIPYKHIPLHFIDLRDRDHPGAREENLEAAIRDAVDTAFDLTSPPLLRLCLIQHEEHQHKLLLAVTHLVVDYVAFHTLFDEFMILYKALASGEPLPPKRTEVQLSDYVYWENDVAKQVQQQEIDYWRQRLESASLLSVPDSYLLRPDEAARSHFVNLDSTLLDALSKISRQQGVSLLMSLSAVLAITLHRIRSQNDICITTIFENRVLQELEHLVTPMSKPVPVRIQLSAGISFPDLIALIKQTTLEAYDHVRSSGFISMWFLVRNRRRGSGRVVGKGKELAIRFFTWLLSRVMFARQAYATLFYGLLYVIATKPPAKNGSGGKMRDSKSDTSLPWDGIEVMVNVLPGFYQTFGPSGDRYGDLHFIPGTLPTRGNSRKGFQPGQDNRLVFMFIKDPEGEPMLRAWGLTSTAHQKLAASFCEVLEAVVKNPGSTLEEMKTKN